MFRRLAFAMAALGAVSTAHADEARPQVHADLGLSVITVGYEHPLTEHVVIAASAGIFGTYFLPWFDAGDNATGGVGNLRATWFAGGEQRGLYVAPYVRAGAAQVRDSDDDSPGLVLTAGAFVGYAFRISTRLDLRTGLGAQYIYIDGPGDTGASTPFAGIDVALGYRL